MVDDLVQNYKNLLSTIFCVDTEEPKKGLKSSICVYDTKDNDRLVAIFNSGKACAEYFNTSTKYIYVNVCRGNLRLGRYKLERVKYEG